MNRYTDDELLRELRSVLDRAEPIGDTDIAVAEAALGWRMLDTELALLVHDSTVDETELVLRGDDAGQRVLAFANDRIRIDVEYAGGQIVGQVSPPEPAVIELHRSDGSTAVSTEADEFGAFVLSDVPTGPASLVCRAPDSVWSVRTSWTSL